MEHYCKPGDLVQYIRTDAVYLLIEIIELSELTIKYRRKGTGFRAIVIYTGRSYSKQGKETKLFIPFSADYYVVLSAASIDQ
jgi:hypothetical protein